MVVCPEIRKDGREISPQRIVEKGDHALLEDLMIAAHFEKSDARSDSYVTCNPPMSIVKTLQQRLGALRFPILSGVINAPTLRPDGSILTKPGYDTATGLLFDPRGVTFPTMSDRPSKADAESALALLDDLIGTFPFVELGDRAVALSAILTAIVRRSLPTAPLHGYTAPVAGSGKSKLVDVASMIASGTAASMISPGKTEEETEKRLGSQLLAGELSHRDRQLRTAPRRRVSVPSVNSDNGPHAHPR